MDASYTLHAVCVYSSKSASRETEQVCLLLVASQKKSQVPAGKGLFKASQVANRNSGSNAEHEQWGNVRRSKKHYSILICILLN